MMNAVYYPGDLENGCGILANGSEFDQSSWSYLNASVTTEPWVEEDVFMGSIQDDSLRHDVNPLETVNSESFMDPSLERNLPSDSFADEPSAISMSPYPDPSRRISAFEDEMWASGPGIAEQHKQHSASPHHSLTYSNSNEPWDPIQLRVTLDDRAFVAFVDSPKSSSDQSVCEALLEPNVASRGSTHAPQDTTLEGSLLKSPPAENQQKLQWEFINVAANGPPRNDNSTWRDASRGHSRGRQGPMDKQKAKDAHIMRKNGACWPCRVSKRRCSLGQPCRYCREHESSISPLSYQICCRSGLTDFDVLYFPAVLISHFNKKEVKSLIGRNVQKFIGHGRVVKVHCGSAFNPMELTVHFFIHKTDTLLNRHHFTGPGKERTLRMIIRRCAPVGMLGVDTDVLKKECLSCIQSMVSHPAYAKQVTAGDMSGIYRRVLGIIHRYSKLEKNCLLDGAMHLHAMHYFMARMLTFTKDSASMVKTVSRKDLGLELPSDVISSRLLNRQLKYAMHILHRRQTKSVLQEFERHLKKREQTGWPISFCVVLILCLCMEDIQIAANNFVFTDAEISQGLRSESYKACWQLEDKPYRQCTQLFHDMYRSHKQKNSRATEQGFNPIMQDVNHQASWSQATQEMIYGICQVINDSEAEMRVLSKASPFDDPDPPGHHILLDDHPARLLSKFLLSFLDVP